MKVEGWDLNSVLQLTRSLIVVLLLTSVCGVSACAQDVAPHAAPRAAQEPPQTPTPKPAAAPRPPADPNKFAIIISGISGEEESPNGFRTGPGFTRRSQTGCPLTKHVQMLTEKPGKALARPQMKCGNLSRRCAQRLKLIAPSLSSSLAMAASMAKIRNSTSSDLT